MPVSVSWQLNKNSQDFVSCGYYVFTINLITISNWESKCFPPWFIKTRNEKKALEHDIYSSPKELWTSGRLASRTEILRLLFRSFRHSLRSVLISCLIFVWEETEAQVSQVVIQGYLFIGDRAVPRAQVFLVLFQLYHFISVNHILIWDYIYLITFLYLHLLFAELE